MVESTAREASTAGDTAWEDMLRMEREKLHRRAEERELWKMRTNDGIMQVVNRDGAIEQFDKITFLETGTTVKWVHCDWALPSYIKSDHKLGQSLKRRISLECHKK